MFFPQGFQQLQRYLTQDDAYIPMDSAYSLQINKIKALFQKLKKILKDVVRLKCHCYSSVLRDAERWLVVILDSFIRISSV